MTRAAARCATRRHCKVRLTPDAVSAILPPRMVPAESILKQSFSVAGVLPLVTLVRQANAVVAVSASIDQVTATVPVRVVLAELVKITPSAKAPLCPMAPAVGRAPREVNTTNPAFEVDPMKRAGAVA